MTKKSEDVTKSEGVCENGKVKKNEDGVKEHGEVTDDKKKTYAGSEKVDFEASTAFLVLLGKDTEAKNPDNQVLFHTYSAGSTLDLGETVVGVTENASVEDVLDSCRRVIDTILTNRTAGLSAHVVMLKLIEAQQQQQQGVVPAGGFTL